MFYDCSTKRRCGCVVYVQVYIFSATHTVRVRSCIMASQDTSDTTESASENKSRLDLMQENRELNEKIIHLEKMYASSRCNEEHIQNEWHKLREECSTLFRNERNTHIEYKKKTEKKISELESEKSGLQKKISELESVSSDLQKWREYYRDQYHVLKREIKTLEYRAEKKEEEKKKELQDVVTKSDMIKFEDCVTKITCLLLDKGGRHYLVQLDEVLLSKNSISMVDTKMFQAEKGEIALQFQEKSAPQAKAYNTQSRIRLDYDTAIQLFAWMKDKFDAPVDFFQKTQMQNMTHNNPLSHNFLLQMQQDRFECPVCFESNPSNVALCLNCNSRLHLGCFPYDGRCPKCRHPLVTLDKDYTYLENHPERRPVILQKPLALIENEDLRKRLKILHIQPMHAQFACTLGLGHYVG